MMGTISRGSVTLLYLTIAPRLFTLNPIDNKSVIEKKIQNQKKGPIRSCFRRKKINKTNSNINMMTSTDEASDKKCFTSEG